MYQLIKLIFVIILLLLNLLFQTKQLFFVEFPILILVLSYFLVYGLLKEVEVLL